VDDRTEAAAEFLRSRYRCERCHKYCRIPCQFTGVEFRDMVEAFCAATTGPGAD
jgi:hypothetical protein